MIVIFNADTGEVIPSFTCPAPQVNPPLAFAGEIKLRFPKNKDASEVSQEVWGLVSKLCPDRPTTIFENALIADGCDYIFMGKVYGHEVAKES